MCNTCDDDKKNCLARTYTLMLMHFLKAQVDLLIRKALS